MRTGPSGIVVLVGLGVALAPRWAHAACSADEARKLYEQARHEFENQRYDESIELLRRAYECEKNRVYLADIARAYEEANRPKQALAAWRVYLDTLDDPAERRATEGRISVLAKLVERLDRLEREQAARARSSGRPSKPKAPAPAPPPRRISTGAWIVLGTAGAATLAGVTLGLLGRSRHSAAVDEPDAERAHDLQTQSVTLTHAANVAFVTAGVLGASAGVWIGIDLSRESSVPTAVAHVSGRF